MYIPIEIITIFALLLASVSLALRRTRQQEKLKLQQLELERAAKAKQEFIRDNIHQRLWSIPDAVGYIFETEYQKRRQEEEDDEDIAWMYPYMDNLEISEAIWCNVNNAELLLDGIETFFAEIQVKYILLGKDWSELYRAVEPYRLRLKDVADNHETTIGPIIEDFLGQGALALKPRSQSMVESVHNEIWYGFENAAKIIAKVLREHEIVETRRTR